MEECLATEHNLSTQIAELKPQSEQLKVMLIIGTTQVVVLSLYNPLYL